MFFKAIILIFISSGSCLSEDEGVVYDYYSGEPASEEQIQYYGTLNSKWNCTLTVFPCDPDDWRRIDGTCNNLKYPVGGSYFVPMVRLLKAYYYNGHDPRKTECGKDLECERSVRLKLLPTGKSISEFSLLMPFYGIFTWSDTGSIHDTDNQILGATYCCEPEHLNDYECTSVFLKEDDPVHRFDGLRCLNSTRPLFYQDFGCTKDAVPSPVAQATQSFDLSQIYNAYNETDTVLRAYEGGLFIVEEADGRVWPISGPSSLCLLNEGAETRCFRHHRNPLIGVTMYIAYYVRMHNYIASHLAAVNPCWDDDTLYNTAKDINIAYSTQIYMYDWMESVIGHENLVKADVIMDGDSPGFRDLYDDDFYPTVSVEYSFAMRWFHTMQETSGKMFDTKGNYVRSVPINNLTLRTGFLDQDQNMEQLTQGFIRQPTSNHHHLDYDMAEQGLGPLQRAMDIPSSDLKKNRLLGVAPYVEYIYYCLGINITSFEDLIKYGITPADKVTLLTELYEHPRDIDLLAGLWVENPIKGGSIPTILTCIMNENMLRAQKSDRFWYERPNRPHAFTAEQLAEIRKMTFASLLCTVGDKVTEVQPRAFKVISAENPLTPCSEIPQTDFSAWATCSNNEYEENTV